jgi:hypothetical protein
MKKKCIPQDDNSKAGNSDEDEYLIDSYANCVELVSLYQQVRDLESQLKTMELDLQKEESALVKKEPQWDIEFFNGQLQLKSEIKSLEEMLLYGNSVIRYLSPFGNTFHTNALVFEREYPSFVQTAMHLLSKYEGSASSASRKASYKAIVQRFSIGFSQWLQPGLFVKQLVDNYFNCYNDTIPIIHEPSYREHYNTLKDPLKDPITLGICAASAISTCKHSIFNSEEKRCIGEYFFNASMDILIDKFDDPECALESVLVINLLQMFMIITLRFSEAKKWASIAVLLCTNLQEENRGYVNLESAQELPRMQRIKNSVIHRNSVLAECLLAIIDFIVSDRRENIRNTHVEFDILPDESPKIKGILEMFNHILELSMHPAFTVVVIQARALSAGDVAELSFADIIRYEEKVIDWWRKLPDYLKLSVEPFHLTKEAIERTTDYRKLLMACYIHTITLSVQGCLIQPKPNKNLETVNNIVRDRAIQLAMHSADMCLLLFKRIEVLDSLCFCKYFQRQKITEINNNMIAPAKLLIRSIDSLMTLIQVQDEKMATAAKLKLNEYMYELSKLVPPDHQVSPSASPFSVLTLTPQGTTPSISELYKTYAIPGGAMVFDIIRTTVNLNIKRDRNTTFTVL